MSTTEQHRLQEKEEAREGALRWSSDFVSAWDRFYSVMAMMEDALTADIRQAEKHGGQIDGGLAGEILLNTYWLRRLMDADAREAKKRLEGLGYSCGPKA